VRELDAGSIFVKPLPEPQSIVAGVSLAIRGNDKYCQLIVRNKRNGLGIIITEVGTQGLKTEF
jgi:hypothetical protein